MIESPRLRLVEDALEFKHKYSHGYGETLRLGLGIAERRHDFFDNNDEKCRNIIDEPGENDPFRYVFIHLVLSNKALKKGDVVAIIQGCKYESSKENEILNLYSSMDDKQLQDHSDTIIQRLQLQSFKTRLCKKECKLKKYTFKVTDADITKCSVNKNCKNSENKENIVETRLLAAPRILQATNMLIESNPNERKKLVGKHIGCVLNGGLCGHILPSYLFGGKPNVTFESQICKEEEIVVLALKDIKTNELLVGDVGMSDFQADFIEDMLEDDDPLKICKLKRLYWWNRPSIELALKPTRFLDGDCFFDGKTYYCGPDGDETQTESENEEGSDEEEDANEEENDELNGDDAVAD